MKSLDSDITSETRGKIRGHASRRRQMISDNFQKIDRVVEYMVQNIERPLQVAELAGMAHLSLSCFFSLFKRRTGCSPIDYFMRLRIRRACRLLESTTLKIKEIAAVMGYEDQFYFSRVFKSISTVAPKCYRNLEPQLQLEINEMVESKLNAVRHLRLSFSDRRRFWHLEPSSFGSTAQHKSHEMPSLRRKSLALIK